MQLSGFLRQGSHFGWIRMAKSRYLLVAPFAFSYQDLYNKYGVYIKEYSNMLSKRMEEIDFQVYQT